MKKLLLLTLFISSCIQAQKTNHTFLPNDPAIEYNGRIDYTDPLKPSFCYSGVSIKTILVGESLSMTLDEMGKGDEQHSNHYTIIVDDSVRSILNAKPGKHTYELVSGLETGKHTIEVYKRTECALGGARFLGFSAPEGVTLEKPIAKTRRIEFIGNSITCGYGNELSIPAPPEGSPNTGFNSKNENNYLTYGSITARNLKASYRCVAYSGRGLYRNNTGSMEGTIPKIYRRIFPDDPSSTLWDLHKEQPDVLVINVGTNDFYLESEGDFVNEGIFTKTYLSFLEELRVAYPHTKIICVVGNMMSDYWPVGRQCWTRIQKLVSDVVAERNAKGDLEVHYFKFDPQTPPYGEDWHPSIPTHRKMAIALTPFIKQVAGW